MNHMPPPPLLLLMEMERFRPQIEKALATGTQGHTYEGMRDSVMAGGMFFSYNDSSCAFLERVLVPAGVVLHVSFAAGTLQGLLDLYEIVAVKAKALGAYKMTILGRKGFLRALKKHGWEAPKVYMERVL